MIYIFADTNIYVGAGYDFTNTFFSEIEKYSQNDEVKLLSCSICEKEVITHIEQDVENTVKPLNKALKTGIFKAIQSIPAHSDMYQSIKEEEIKKDLIASFNDYLRRVKAERFSIEEISVEELMDDYFNVRAPFEIAKPKEFKDAIMIKALKVFQKQLGEQIHIVSEDKGFRAAFDGDDNFIVHEYYKKFLKYVQEREEEACRAFEAFYLDELNEDVILEFVKEFFDDCNYYDYNRPEFDVVDIPLAGNEQLEFLYCEIESDTVAKIHLLVDVDVQVTVRYLDEENSVYDNEEKEYLFKSYIEAIEEHHVQKEIVIEGSFSLNGQNEWGDSEDIVDKYSCDLEKLDSKMNDYDITLDDDTLIDVIECNTSDSEADRKYFLENSEFCSECGKRIGYIGKATYFTYDEKPLCDSCMQDNEHGFICPNCGLKYPEELRGASGMFCERCEAELDV